MADSSNAGRCVFSPPRRESYWSRRPRGIANCHDDFCVPHRRRYVARRSLCSAGMAARRHPPCAAASGEPTVPKMACRRRFRGNAWCPRGPFVVFARHGPRTRGLFRRRAPHLRVRLDRDLDRELPRAESCVGAGRLLRGIFGVLARSSITVRSHARSGASRAGSGVGTDCAGRCAAGGWVCPLLCMHRCECRAALGLRSADGDHGPIRDGRPRRCTESSSPWNRKHSRDGGSVEPSAARRGVPPAGDIRSDLSPLDRRCAMVWPRPGRGTPTSAWRCGGGRRFGHSRCRNTIGRTGTESAGRCAVGRRGPHRIGPPVACRTLPASCLPWRDWTVGSDRTRQRGYRSSRLEHRRDRCANARSVALATRRRGRRSRSSDSVGSRVGIRLLRE